MDMCEYCDEMCLSYAQACQWSAHTFKSTHTHACECSGLGKKTADIPCFVALKGLQANPMLLRCARTESGL